MKCTQTCANPKLNSPDDAQCAAGAAGQALGKSQTGFRNSYSGTEQRRMGRAPP